MSPSVTLEHYVIFRQAVWLNLHKTVHWSFSYLFVMHRQGNSDHFVTIKRYEDCCKLRPTFGTRAQHMTQLIWCIAASVPVWPKELCDPISKSNLKVEREISHNVLSLLRRHHCSNINSVNRHFYKPRSRTILEAAVQTRHLIHK